MKWVKCTLWWLQKLGKNYWDCPVFIFFRQHYMPLHTDPIFSKLFLRARDQGGRMLGQSAAVPRWNFTATIDAIYEMYTKMNAELDYTVWSHKLQTSSNCCPTGSLLPPCRHLLSLLIGPFFSRTGSCVFSWGTIRVPAAEDLGGFGREDVCYCLFCSCWLFECFGFSLEK